MALVILGLGNDLLGDDGVGLLVAKELSRYGGPDVAVRSTAQSGLYLLEHVQEYDDAIIVDTVVGDHPGLVRDLTIAEVRPIPVPSAHYAGLPEAFALARAAGIRVPSRVRIITVEISDGQLIGSEVSPAVSASVPRLLARVVDVAGEWGYTLGASGAEGGGIPCTNTA